jgi:hypothetical protein
LARASQEELAEKSKQVEERLKQLRQHEQERIEAKRAKRGARFRQVLAELASGEAKAHTLTKRDGPRYWDKRFETETQFEWYLSWQYLEPFLVNLPFFHTSSRILVIGCGNSPTSQQMCDAGYRFLTNMDCSAHVIELMRSKHEKHMLLRESKARAAGTLGPSETLPRMRWDVGDVTGMPEYADGSMEVVLDKGCLCALRCMSNHSEILPKMLAETSRVLTSGGVYICIASSSRSSHLAGPQNCKAYRWETELIKIPRPNQMSVGGGERDRLYYFMYLCKKK